MDKKVATLFAVLLLITLTISGCITGSVFEEETPTERYAAEKEKARCEAEADVEAWAAIEYCKKNPSGSYRAVVCGEVIRIECD